MMLKGFFKAITDRLKTSKRLHFRQNRVTSPKEVIALVDRFIDGKLDYPLEWDDFISWNNSNSSVERIREQIAALEPLFFSKEQKSRNEAAAALAKIRNHYASLLGLPARD
jgi:hypothetical protein